jgi:hypothetical protein
VYVKVSVPSNPSTGVYRTVPSGWIAAEPCCGWVTLSTVSASPSGSPSFERTSTSTGRLRPVRTESPTGVGLRSSASNRVELSSMTFAPGGIVAFHCWLSVTS